MDDLSVDEISHILSYVGYPSLYERVSTSFVDASLYEKERLVEYMNRMYPRWHEGQYLHVFINMLALDARWDLVMVMLDHYGYSILTHVLEVMHVFLMEPLADKIIRRCGLPTGSIDPIIVYHMWRLDIPFKEERLRELIESKMYKTQTGGSAIILRRLIGYITPEARQYIIDAMLPEGRYNDLGAYLLYADLTKMGSNGLTRISNPHLFEYTTDTYYQHVLYSYNHIPVHMTGRRVARLQELGRAHVLTAQIGDVFRQQDLPKVLSLGSNIILMIRYPHLIDIDDLNKLIIEHGADEELQMYRFFNIIG